MMFIDFGSAMEPMFVKPRCKWLSGMVFLRWTARTYSLMKKGLRRPQRAVARSGLGQNIFPDEEGIKTSPGALPSQRVARTYSLMKKGLRPNPLVVRKRFVARTYSLMKKGLRHPSRLEPVLTGQNIFPDEEGIKTKSDHLVSPGSGARTYSLMKKGLRPSRLVSSMNRRGQNIFPDEEGIKTGLGCPRQSQNGQNIFPDEEGIKT